MSQIRIVNASPDAPGLDIYQNSAIIARNLGFGTITSYVPVDPGTYTTATTVYGTKQTLSSSKTTFVTASQYTVLIGNVAASLQQLTLKDQSQPAPSGQIALRFIDQATRIAAVDIYLIPAGSKLTDVTPVYTDLTFGINTGYLNIPVGTYSLVMVPTGTIPTSTTVLTYSGPQVTYTSSSASTVILIDQQLLTAPGLQVIIAPDYVSPTATS
jgi:PKD repeat protein